jgi:spermidine synthase
MIPRELIDTAEIPGGGGTLRLIRRGQEWSIMLGANELMNSRLSGSEEALAEMGCARIRDRARPALLIGGLGMGFTLRAALAALGPAAQVTVAELVPAVVEWAQGPMAAIFAGCLDDPRVAIEVADVAGLIATRRAAWDAILLDVDNGPDGLTRASNDRLYARDGLAAARTALKPGGVLAIWSSGADPAFTQRLRKAGFAVDEQVVRAHGARGGARHILWFASRP